MGIRISILLALLAAACSGPAAQRAPVPSPAAPPSAGGEPAVGPAAGPAAEPARAPMLEVLAVDEAGEPLAGATVHAVGDAGLSSAQALLASRSTGDYAATIEALASAHGVTDAEGRVQLARPSGSSVLVAVERGAHFGTFEGPADTESPAVSVEARTRTLYQAWVQELNGMVAIDVDVSAAVENEFGELEILPVTARSLMPGAELLVPTGSLGGRKPFALARIPSAEPIRAAFDVNGVAALTLPDTMALTARLDRDDVGAWIQIFAAREGSRSDSTLVHLSEGGVAKLGRAEVGVGLRAVAVLRSLESGELLGRVEWTVPESVWENGGVITVPLEDTVELTGRAVDADGVPLAETNLVLRVLGRPRWTWPARTDADGGFRWIAPRRVVAGERLRADVGSLGPTEAREVPADLGVECALGDFGLAPK